MDERVVGVRAAGLNLSGHAAHDAARVLEQARAAVPVDQRAVGGGGGLGPASLDDARGVGGAAPPAEVADKPVGERNVGWARRGAHEAERRVEVAPVDQGAEAAVRPVQAARRRPSASAGLGETRRAGF